MADDNPLPGFLADIRRKAQQAAREMNPTNDPGKVNAQTILAMAWQEEINDWWDERVDCATGDDRTACELAIKYGRAYHNMLPTDETHRNITPAYPGPCPVHRVPFTAIGHSTGDLPALSAMLGGARPLWTHYLSLAHLTLGFLKK